MLAIASILLDGQELPLDQVAADLTIRQGRGGYFESASPSTCQLTVIGATRALTRSITLSSPLVVNYTVDGGAPLPRFTGRTTDANLEDDRLTVIAVGRLATLDAYTVGKVAYPLERWDDRIRKLFTEAGLTGTFYFKGYSQPPYCNPRPANPVSLAQYLDELCNMASAILNDEPGGLVRIEEANTRDGSSPITVPPEKVLYAPTWEKVLPGSNKATVPFGTANPQATRTASDAAAIAQYGERATTITPSEIAYGDPYPGSLTAQDIANRIVQRQAAPRWTTPAATLLEPIEVAIGQAVKLPGLPASAPYSPWTAIVEGWTDTINAGRGELVWTMELALSDPLLSGVIVHVAWEDLPPTDLWNTIDPTITWETADELA